MSRVSPSTVRLVQMTDAPVARPSDALNAHHRSVPTDVLAIMCGANTRAMGSEAARLLAHDRIPGELVTGLVGEVGVAAFGEVLQPLPGRGVVA